MVITVVDVLKFDMYLSNFSEFYKNQITNAKTVILGRTQNTTSEKIKCLNDKANIITIPWEKLSAIKILEVSSQNFKSSFLEHINLIKRPLNTASIKIRTNYVADEVFQTFGIETPKIFSKDNLNKILDKIKNDMIYSDQCPVIQSRIFCTRR